MLVNGVWQKQGRKAAGDHHLQINGRRGADKKARW